MTAPFLSLEQLRRFRSAKWTVYGPEVLPAWVAEMDVEPCPAAVQAVSQALAAGDTGYPDFPGYLAGHARYFTEHWDWPVSAESIRPVTDVMTGLASLINLFTEPGDQVAISPPVYPPFFMVNQLTRRQFVAAPLTEQGRLDLDALERVFAGGAKAYLLCNPANPVGTVPTHAELTDLAELAARHRVRVFSDEIHAPLVFDDATFTPYLSLPGTETAVTVFSATKAWNLAAMKGAAMVFGQEALQHTSVWPMLAGSGLSHYGALSQLAVLADGHDWLRITRNALQANRDLLGRLLAERLPQIPYRPNQATYLAWLDCRGLRTASGADLGADPAEHFLSHGKVAFNHGPAFGEPGTGHVRLNFATSPELLTEIVDRMAGALQ